MNTTIHGIDFGPIWGMSGVQNFFGEGYWYHSLFKSAFGMSFEGMAFSAKTTTFMGRPGKMALNKKLQPIEWVPRCIYVDPFKAIVLNAVSLSGPGLPYLLGQDIWQNFNSPFWLSYMSVAATAEEKLWETELFTRAMRHSYPRFKQKFGIQINRSCPNVGNKDGADVADAHKHLDKFDWLVDQGAAVLVKFAADMPVEKVMEIAAHKNCHGICISNTIPFGALPEEIDWKGLFPNGSPLKARKDIDLPGGLSGKPLQKIVRNWVRNARQLGFKKHINAGGGILCPQNVLDLYYAGADSFSIGSIVMLRPWRVNSVIRTAHAIHKNK